jgi:hypothetical protein
MAAVIPERGGFAFWLEKKAAKQVQTAGHQA